MVNWKIKMINMHAVLFVIFAITVWSLALYYSLNHPRMPKTIKVINITEPKTDKHVCDCLAKKQVNVIMKENR